MLSSVAEGIDLLLTEPDLPALVAAYFEPSSPFAGHMFDELGDNPATEFIEADLLAVTLLDVGFEPRAVRELVGRPDRWRAMLETLPTDVPLWAISDDHYNAADVLWNAVVRLPGVGPTKAGKLLARKRPSMLPIYDDVISTFLAPGETGFWRELQAALQDDERRR